MKHKTEDDLAHVIEKLERLVEALQRPAQFQAVDHLPEPHQASYEEILGHYRRHSQEEAVDFDRTVLARRQELLRRKP